MRRQRDLTARRGVAALVVAVFALTALGGGSGTAAALPGLSSSAFNSLTEQSHTDWMRNLPNWLGLGAMSIPGTHDTLAIHGGLAPWAYEAQENHGDGAATLNAQLTAGVRAIDIRVRVVNSGAAFAIHHTNVYQHANFDDVLANARSFLSAHPHETILMKLTGECDANSTEGGSGTDSIGHCVDDPSTTTRDDRIRIFRSYLARYPGLFYAPTVAGNSTADVPNLGQVRGRIVLTDFSGPGGRYGGYGLRQYTSNIENDWQQCDTGKKWAVARANIASASADTTSQMYTTYLSANCAPFGPGPAEVAGGGLFTTGVNQLALNGLLGNGSTQLPRTGVVLMDYPGHALIGTIIARNSLPATAISFRAHANGRLVTAEDGGTSPLIANRTAIGPWEKFDVLHNTDGSVSFRAHANGRLVTAEDGGTSPLIANRTAIGPWEKFDVLHNTDGSVSFRAHANGRLVTAEDGGTSPLIANRTAIGPWEKFDIQ